ncbi:DUF2852 domain-containing protein [Paracoccus jiaweipingae]|uniref:DUF2852 domain-containing protein n=1 Tax=unclassified Paracoccus (in: a-proteobacteria) TaxID=2688777 RepID=UPI003789CE48
MTTTAYDQPAVSRGVWGRVSDAFEGVRDWLDAGGRPAWILAIIAGFIIAGPLGFILLFYAVWSKRMFANSTRRHARHSARSLSAETGNIAFDSYRAETLKRLEDEQRDFEAFLEKLREAKDKAEFDQFMSQRRDTA